MNSYTISIVVGSLRKESLNRKLAETIVQLAPPQFSFTSVRIDDLPLYNQDDDDNQADSVIRLKSQIADSDGVVFVTPEYNRSIPGVLKNAIDHASRPHSASAWRGKPAGMLGVSIGPGGSAMAQQHLRNVLAALGMPTMTQPEAYLRTRDGQFYDNGYITEAGLKFLQRWMEQYFNWVTTFKAGS